MAFKPQEICGNTVSQAASCGENATDALGIVA